MKIPSPSPSPDLSRIEITPEGLKTGLILLVVFGVCLLLAAATNKRGS